MAYRRRMVNLESNLLGTSKTSGGAGGGTKDHDAAGGGQPPLADDAAAPGAAVPAITEDVLDVLLRALCHGDTIVRWSAAKGVGRICERLPRAAADDVVTAILGIFDELDNDSGWHGACLALAELCRRWALMPERFGEVVPLVAKALRFDVSRDPTRSGRMSGTPRATFVGPSRVRTTRRTCRRTCRSSAWPSCSRRAWTAK